MTALMIMSTSRGRAIPGRRSAEESRLFAGSFICRSTRLLPEPSHAALLSLLNEPAVVLFRLLMRVPNLYGLSSFFHFWYVFPSVWRKKHTPGLWNAASFSATDGLSITRNLDEAARNNDECIGLTFSNLFSVDATDQCRSDHAVPFDISNLQSSYANACNVSSTREEMVLNVGVMNVWELDNLLRVTFNDLHSRDIQFRKNTVVPF
jgi:hypothetical protein